MKHRLLFGIGMAVLAVAGLFYLPLGGAFVVMAGLTGLLMREFYSLFKVARPPFPIFDRIGIACGLALMTAAFLDALPQLPSRNGGVDLDSWERFVIFLTIAVVMVRQFPQKNNNQPIMTIAGTLFGIFYVAYLLTFLMRLGVEFDEHASWRTPIGVSGRFLMLFLIVTVKAADAGAYFVGCRYGRRRLFPRISPLKSWEGLLGGVLTGTLAGLAVYFLMGEPVSPWTREFGDVRLHVWDALFLGILLTIAGAIGDLVESLLKRAVAAKDSGRTLPGLGGLLDVFDSLLYTAPILYFYVRAFSC